MPYKCTVAFYRTNWHKEIIKQYMYVLLLFLSLYMVIVFNLNLWN